MPETAGELMKRVKTETSNLDPYDETDALNVSLWITSETLALVATPTATARGPVYYAGDGSIGDNVEDDVAGTTIFSGFFKSS